MAEVAAIGRDSADTVPDVSPPSLDPVLSQPVRGFRPSAPAFRGPHILRVRGGAAKIGMASGSWPAGSRRPVPGSISEHLRQSHQRRCTPAGMDLRPGRIRVRTRLHVAPQADGKPSRGRSANGAIELNAMAPDVTTGSEPPPSMPSHPSVPVGDQPGDRIGPRPQLKLVGGVGLGTRRLAERRDPSGGAIMMARTPTWRRSGLKPRSTAWASREASLARSRSGNRPPIGRCCSLRSEVACATFGAVCLFAPW